MPAQTWLLGATRQAPGKRSIITAPTRHSTSPSTATGTSIAGSSHTFERNYSRRGERFGESVMRQLLIGWRALSEDSLLGLSTTASQRKAPPTPGQKHTGNLYTQQCGCAPIEVYGCPNFNFMQFSHILIRYSHFLFSWLENVKNCSQFTVCTETKGRQRGSSLLNPDLGAQLPHWKGV